MGELFQIVRFGPSKTSIIGECALNLLPEQLHSPEPRLRPDQTPQGALEERAYAALGVYPPDRRPAFCRQQRGTADRARVSGVWSCS